MLKKNIVLWFMCIFTVGFSKTTQDDVFVNDAKFLGFLRKNYPQVLDAYSDRIVATKAELVTGVLDCSGLGICDLNGIQLFTNISKLDVHSNSLIVLPILNNLINLQSLNVSLNKLTELPALSANTQLLELIVTGNNLRALPDLSSNVLLKQLIVDDNHLIQLPKLRNLINLTNLVVDNNSLTTLPDLDNCRLLEKLICGVNLLASVPSLDSLIMLKSLDLSFNKLTVFPNLNHNLSLEYIYINDNEIDSLPTLPLFRYIQKVRLYNNRLRFRSLVQVLNFVGHANIFEVIGQKNDYLNENIRITRNDTLVIAPKIDDDVDGVYYEWHKNNLLYKTIVEGELMVPDVNFSDSGTYYCVVKHDSFPNLVFRSNDYIVKVRNCINLSKLSTVVSGATCEQSGKLVMSGLVYYKGMKCELTCKANGNTYMSENGEFSGLLEGDYFLKMTTSKGCVVEYPKEVNIPKLDCNYPLITPNDDGEKDSYYFGQSGHVNIYDKHGQLVKSMNIPGIWDASSKEGKVKQGLYIADINDGDTIIKISVVY